MERVALQDASHGRKIVLLDVNLGTREHGLVVFHTTEDQSKILSLNLLGIIHLVSVETHNRN